MSFLATGGGHGYTWSLNRLQGGIDLDLGNFDTISIDGAADTMTIGGSARSDNVTRALQAADVALGRPVPDLDPLSGRPTPLRDDELAMWGETARGRKVNARLHHPGPATTAAVTRDSRRTDRAL